MNSPLPLRIGLTGGIGSGKSTVSGYFRDLGVPVIDTDEIARALVEPGAPGLAPVAAAFGPGIVDSAGELDRASLRRIVFADPRRRRELEAILHPLVREEVRRQVRDLANAGTGYCIIVIPLLVDTGQFDLVDRVAVVDVPEDVQVQRVAQRPGWSVEDARQALSAQVSRAERLRAADDVIANDAGLAALRETVVRLHDGYRALAQGRSRT